MPSHHRPTLTALLCLALAATGCAGDPERDENSQAVADTINVVFHHAKWRQVPATAPSTTTPPAPMNSDRACARTSAGVDPWKPSSPCT